MTSEEILKVIDTLLGDVDPIGDSQYDRDALSNVKTMTEICDGMIKRVHDASLYADRLESSVRKVGELALRYYNGIKYNLD